MRPTVLIADADELLVRAYQAFLIVEGFQVNWVTNGLDCLESLRQNAHQALILDAELLWGSWKGVLEVMNHDPNIAGVPVVILTARPEALPRARVGPNTPVTLLKPIAPASMALMVRSLLEPQLACSGI